MGVADPLRTEHAQLLPQLEALPAAAIATEGREDEVLAALDAALAFLRESLIPHARAEDAVLYPRVEQVMHAPGATATMSRDHLEVVRLTAALGRVRDSLQGALDPDRRRELQPSASLKDNTATTGPKISSRATLISGVTSSMTVAPAKWPPVSASSFSPPVTMRAPSARACWT
jgi:hypothetical protein